MLQLIRIDQRSAVCTRVLDADLVEPHHPVEVVECPKHYASRFRIGRDEDVFFLAANDTLLVVIFALRKPGLEDAVVAMNRDCKIFLDRFVAISVILLEPAGEEVHDLGLLETECFGDLLDRESLTVQVDDVALEIDRLCRGAKNHTLLLERTDALADR